MHHVVLLINALDPVPDDNDVKAGWGAFAIFVLLIVAVALLCWSFARQMRKVKAANEAGVYDEHGDAAAGSGDPDGSDGSGHLPPTHTRSDS